MKTLKLIFCFFLIFNCSAIAQWTQTGAIPPGGGITDMIMTDAGTLIVTTASFNWPSGQPGGIRRSTDGGNFWEEPINNYIGRTLAISRGGFIFASSWPFPNSEALFRSTDDGQTFFQMYPIGAGNNIFSILAPTQDNNTIYLGTRNGVLKSTNGGAVFNPVNNGIPVNSWVRDLETDSNGTIAAATTNGLFYSINAGTSWQQTTGIQPGDTLVNLAFDYPISTIGSESIRLNAGATNGNMYAALTDSNNNYPLASLVRVFGNREISDITILTIQRLNQQNRKIFGVSTYGGTGQNTGFLKSTNTDTNWVPWNIGLPPNRLISATTGAQIDTSGNFVFFAGLFENTVNGSRVFKLEKTIGIQTLSSEIPDGFFLSQNYPNPFNPVTNIRFDIAKFSNSVSLKVYSTLGKEVAVLVNQSLQPGAYEVSFNSGNLSSGIYFYELITDNFRSVKKMVLVR